MNLNKTYFIAEAGVNHNGDKAMAIKLIEEAAMAGANAIKFQTFNAKKIVDYLMSQKLVKEVYWPGLKSHPNHKIAKKQMRDFGGMVSFKLKKNSFSDAKKFLSNLKVFTLAESLGGVESLISHPFSMTHASLSDELKAKNKITLFSVS